MPATIDFVIDYFADMINMQVIKQYDALELYRTFNMVSVSVRIV